MENIIPTFFEFASLTGMVIFIAMLLRKKTREIMRVQWQSVASFMAFLAFITIVRLARLDFLMDLGVLAPDMPMEFIDMPIWRFLMVFWEDAFFAIPLYYVWKHMKKAPAVVITILMSLIFGTGHSYQGMMAVAFTSLYPYFISLKYGKKYGFGTVMVCHITYDVVTFYTMYFAAYLI